MDVLFDLLTILSPIMVAVVAAYSSVLVAKISRVQKDIKTNHGTANIGQAIDVIRSRVDVIATSQADVIKVVKEMNKADEDLNNKIDRIENRVESIEENKWNQ